MQDPVQILAGIRAVFGNLFAGEGQLAVLDTDGDGRKVRHGLEKEAFGDDGWYEIMTFGDGEQEVVLKSGHSYTLTVNVEELDPNADSVGSDYESWGDF